ncbi:MAG: hypothetical protein ACTHOP_07580 [Mesorhizobium sp.]
MSADISRRRMLLGLAAASTAAASTVGDAIASRSENPKLLALAAELPAIAATFHAANDKYKAEYDAWNDKTPDAPDELTIAGKHPWDESGQPGEAEQWALGGFMWRSGTERFPRRIVLQAWQVSCELTKARRWKRRAKKEGNLADFMAAEAEVDRLRALYSKANAYEREFWSIRTQASAWHHKAEPAKDELRDALERHVAAIMNERDLTMEGLVIKAQALAEWDRVGEGWGERIALKYGQDWQGQIAAAILRHAGGQRNG